MTQTRLAATFASLLILCSCGVSHESESPRVSESPPQESFAPINDADARYIANYLDVKIDLNREATVKNEAALSEVVSRALSGSKPDGPKLVGASYGDWIEEGQQFHGVAILYFTGATQIIYGPADIQEKVREAGPLNDARMIALVDLETKKLLASTIF